MEELKHTEAPITEANSIATLKKINEIIIYCEALKQDVDYLVEDNKHLSLQIEKLEHEIEVKNE